MGLKRSRLVLPHEDYKALCGRVHARDQWRCAVPRCQRRNNLHCHHIKFRSQGGDDADWNLLTLCDECHRALHNRYMVIQPRRTKADDQFITLVDANEGVRFTFLSGWKPSRKIR